MTQLWLPHPPEQVFPFFADAANLQAITPPWLNFQILSPMPITMAEGTLIDYRLRLRGIPIRWRTRIAAWEPPCRFVDMQVRGPYRLWHHEHTFTPLDGGVLCRDVVHYRHAGGRLLESRFIRPDLTRIFTYRQSRLADIFRGEAIGYAGTHAPDPTLPR
ncbi:MAG: SRPBCC family protein [Phycisphaeraceae bacterium]|nr:SRPBCC family protein [Phycisphaeraceae bacterium]